MGITFQGLKKPPNNRDLWHFTENYTVSGALTFIFDPELCVSSLLAPAVPSDRWGLMTALNLRLPLTCHLAARKKLIHENAKVAPSDPIDLLSPV